MQRTLNYTGKGRIERSEVRIKKEYDSGHPLPLIDAEFNFKERGLPGESKIYLEAYHRNTLQRFDFGTLKCIMRPEERKLDQIDHSGPTLFRVRIIDESEEVGKVLASAEKLRAEGEGDEDEDQRSSLLELISRPLGQQTWKLSFETNGKPALVINSNIPDALEKIRSNRFFKTLILPAALREVLMYLAWSDLDDEDPLLEQWITFAESIYIKRPLERQPDVQMEWIDDVVERFSERFSLCDVLVSEMEVSS